MKNLIKTKEIRTFTIFLGLMMFIRLFPYAQEKTSHIEDDPFNQASQEYNNGFYESALRLFETSLQIRKEKNGDNSLPVASAIARIGNTKIQLGLYEGAISDYKHSLQIYEQFGDKELLRIGYAYLNLAICYNTIGDIQKATSYYERTERIFQKLQLKDQSVYEILLMNLTDFYLDNKNIGEAEKFNKKSFETNPASIHAFKKWNSFGSISLEKKEYAKSISSLNKALSIGEKDLGKNFSQKGLVYMTLGKAYLEMGDFEHSLFNYLTAKELIESRIGKQGVSYSTCLKDIGLNYLLKKENESDLEKFLIQRGKNILTSLDYFQQAIKAITPGFAAAGWNANPIPEEAVDKIRLLDALKNKADALYQLAQLHEKQGDSESAVRMMQQSLDTYQLSVKTIHLIRSSYQSQESRLFLSENEHPVYAEAVRVAVRLYERTGKQEYFEKGFEFSERSRAANFQTMLRELQAKEFSGLPDSLISKDTEIKSEISAYEGFIFAEKSAPGPDQKKINMWKDKVFSLNQKYQQMLELFETKYPQYYQYKYADPVVPVEKIQKTLGRREAFVEYFIHDEKRNGENELYTFVITNNQTRVFSNRLGNEFDHSVDQFLKFLKSGSVLKTRKADYVRFADEAFSLYKILLKPAVGSLQNFKLVVVPDDKLAYLPFDALLASEADTTRMDFTKLDYLVHHHAVSYTYSATLLYHYFQDNLKYSSKLGAFAPDYSGTAVADSASAELLLPLPGAEKEVNGVTGLFNGDLFTRGNATKQSFLQNAGKYDMLHMAMHTVLNDTLPLYSKMVFSADTSGEKGRLLNTYEIYNLKLRSQMVVLSGCNTGSGKLQKGEGVMSLARAFLYAGCPSIIMTLWNVEDASSSSIMVEFYRNIKKGLPKDEALRRAKISYLSQADPLKAHPYFWLGYVSIGKQSPLVKTKVGYFVGLIIFVFLAFVLEKWYFKRKKR